MKKSYTTVLKYGMLKLNSQLLKEVDYRYRGQKIVQIIQDWS